MNWPEQLLAMAQVLLRIIDDSAPRAGNS